MQIIDDCSLKLCAATLSDFQLHDSFVMVPLESSQICPSDDLQPFIIITITITTGLLVYINKNIINKHQQTPELSVM